MPSLPILYFESNESPHVATGESGESSIPRRERWGLSDWLSFLARSPTDLPTMPTRAFESLEAIRLVELGLPGLSSEESSECFEFEEGRVLYLTEYRGYSS